MTHLANANNSEFKIDFDVFSYAIPFVSFVLDHSIKRVTNQNNQEKSIWVFLKLAIIVYYLGVYVMSLEIKAGSDSAEQNKFYTLTTIDLLAFPLVSGVYSWALYNLYLN